MCCRALWLITVYFNFKSNTFKIHFASFATGVSQLDDHTYFMNMTFFPDYNRTADEELFSEQILDLGTSFVKNENR